MKFKQETGAIINMQGHAIRYFDGSPGHVDFDEEFVAHLVRNHMGIWKFAHVHPDEVTSLSETDKRMMRTLAPMLYPLPVRLSIITMANVEIYDKTDLFEYTYVAEMESKERWKNSGRRFREINIFRETFEWVYRDVNPWQNQLIERSYE